jgi:hypothetical protein
MRKVLLTVAVLAMSLSLVANASAFTKEAVRVEPGSSPSGLSQDCTLIAYNNCSGWIWVFTELDGAVWGHVYNPADCAGGCTSGGAVSDIWIYGRCDLGPGITSGAFGNVGVHTVDAADCLVSDLYNTGPFTTTHCVAGDRWHHVSVPLVHVNGEDFAVTVTWGDPTLDQIPLATENAIANLICSFGVTGTFPGCFNSTLTCVGWSPSTNPSYIYASDFNGDTLLDDLCAIYGYPYAIAFPYYPGYGYLANPMRISVGLDCTSPTATENTSWGHVKALYE